MQSQSQSRTQSRFCLSESLPRVVIFLMIKLRRGFSQLSFVYVLFAFNIFLISYFCVVSSFEPPLDPNNVKGSFKKFFAHTERGAIAEHFCCSNSLLPFIKLEKTVQIFFLISVQMRSIQRWEACEKFLNWQNRIIWRSWQQNSSSIETAEKMTFDQAAQKRLTTDEQADAIHRMVLHDRYLNLQ